MFADIRFLPASSSTVKANTTLWQLELPQCGNINNFNVLLLQQKKIKKKTCYYQLNAFNIGTSCAALAIMVAFS